VRPTAEDRIAGDGRHTVSTRAHGEGSPPVEDIVRAALALIDRDGLDALTTRRLAGELGIFQPVIYRRVRNRDELLDRVAEVIVADAGVPGVDPGDWRAWLADCGLRLFRSWRRHPRAAPLVYRGAGTPAILRLFDAIFAVLLGAGFDEGDVVDCVQLYLGHVFGVTFLESVPGATRPAQALDVDLAASYPHLAAMQKRLPKGAQSTAAAERTFVDGLGVLLDGLAHRRQTPGTATRRRRA